MTEQENVQQTGPAADIPAHDTPGFIPSRPVEETAAGPVEETATEESGAAPAGEPTPPPVLTPTDQPPPPGPQPAPTTQGAVTNQPSFIAPRTEGGARMQEGASAYLPDGTPIDNVGIVRATIKNPQTGQDQEVTAAKTDPDKVVTGAAGQAIAGREMGAAGVTKTLSPRPVEAAVTQANLMERYLQSRVARELGPSISRPATDLGLVGQGHVVVGHMILMDSDSGELVRVLPGTRIEEDKVYVNTRNLPEWLVEGNLGTKMVGGR